MKYQGLCDGTYSGKSLTPAGDRCKNLYPETMNGAGSPEAEKVLLGTPGLSFFKSAASGPIQAIYREPGNPLILVIANSNLYTLTVNLNLIGAVGNGPYTLNSNGTQVMISCAGDNSGYIFTVLTNVLTRITTAAFLGSVTNAMIDNYFISSPTSGTTNARKFQISGLSDGLSWASLDFAFASGGPEAIVALHADHGELWIFGSRHAEIYQDTGNASFPFERIKSIYISHGLISRKAIVSLDNSVFWLGVNESGQCRVFRSDGYIPRGISNRSVEYFFNLYAAQNGVYDASMYGYQNETGHTFLVINFPSATVDISPTGGATANAISGAQWVYDITENEWHERMTLVSGKETIPPMMYHVFDEALGHIVGGGDGTANLYLMKEDVYTYNGTAIQRIRRAPHIVNGLKWIVYHFLRLSAQVGAIPIGAADNLINLRVSNDGGITWSNTYSKALGFIGEYKKELCWRMLGRAKRRAFEFSTTVNAPVCLIDADLGVEGEQ